MVVAAGFRYWIQQAAECFQRHKWTWVCRVVLKSRLSQVLSHKSGSNRASGRCTKLLMKRRHGPLDQTGHVRQKAAPVMKPFRMGGRLDRASTKDATGSFSFLQQATDPSEVPG